MSSIDERISTLEADDKTLFHQIDELKEEVKDIRRLTIAIEKIAGKVDNIGLKVDNVDNKVNGIDERLPVSVTSAINRVCVPRSTVLTPEAEMTLLVCSAR